MRLTRPHCVGVTSTATHAQEDLSTYSCSPGAAPTNPLFSAFDLGGGRASDLSFTERAYEGQNHFNGRIKLLTLNIKMAKHAINVKACDLPAHTV